MNRIFEILLTAALTSSPLLAGVVYEIEVKDHEHSPPRSESIQAVVEGGHLKMGIASKGQGRQGEMIYRGDQREMVVVDHEKKTYVVIDRESIQQLAGQVNDGMRQMQEALQKVPEEQRAVVEQMMKERMPPARPKSELRRTSERANQNGYPCVKYEILTGGRKTGELWVTDWSNVEGGRDVIDAFEDMADFLREMMEAIPRMGTGKGPSSGIDTNGFEHMKEVGGFPVVIRDFDDNGSLEGETALRSAKRQTIDPDAFEPPSGYKRQQMLRGQ